MQPHPVRLSWAVAGGPAGFSWIAAGAVFAAGVVIIVVAAAAVGRRRGRTWGVAWGMRSRRRRGGVERAAAEDVAAMRAEDARYFRSDGPGHQQDDL
jgi:hypothetical protein